jgi:two-component system nitrogen regulation response regulator NtrX
LRERPEDIPCLIDHALAEFNEKHGTHLAFHPDLVRQLQTMPWPGNVRELKNLVWQMASESGEDAGEITTAMLSAELVRGLACQDGVPAVVPQAATSAAEPNAAEEQHWRALCQQYHGDVYAIADAVGVHRTTVIRKLKGYGLAYARKRSSRARQGDDRNSAAIPAAQPLPHGPH